MAGVPGFGIFALMQQRQRGRGNASVFADLAEHVAFAEEAGFEAVWFAEHHFSAYSLCPSPLLAAAHFAARTRRIRLGTGVVVLPIYQPLRLLQEIAMVDQLAQGRLLLGLGGGYQPYEFDRFGRRLEDSAALFEECLDIVEAGLTRDEVAYDGAHFQVPPTRIALRPVQQPLPPIYLAGMTGVESIQQRAARGDWVPFVTNGIHPWDAAIAHRAAHDARRAAAGHGPGQGPFALMTFFHCTGDRAEARDAAERARYSGRASLSLGKGYHEFADGPFLADPPMAIDRSIDEVLANTLIGSPDELAERIARMVTLFGPTHIAFNAQPGDLPQERVMRSLELFVARCLPQIERALDRGRLAVALPS